MIIRLFILIATSFLLSACEEIAVLSTPPKKATPDQSHLALTAQKTFWETLHTGNYQKIPSTTKLLTAAYLENPNDPQLAAHLGFLHIWKITERQRDPALADDPTIVNEIILAKEYFSDAVQLAPHDARYQGFLGDSQLITGDIFRDPREEVRGYYQLKRAIHLWPEFNLFTAGYPMSVKHPQSDAFKEAIAWQWETVDLCAGTHVNRSNPDFKPYLNRETQQGPLRACWNSWIAPHNFEGFFLNMGDMLVKQGDWKTATILYKNAKLSKTYNQWPYQSMLEKRISHAEGNVAHFNAPHATPEKTILFNSGHGCSVCHQR